MTDREKIICAIERAKRQSEEYAQDRIFVPFKEADMIISLLKEQEPVEPIEKDGWHYCGICGRSLDGDFADEELFPYCPNCGRKVKLND